MEARADVIESDAFASERQEFDECVEEHLGETVEHVADLELLAGGDEGARTAMETCGDAWTRAARTAERPVLDAFIDEHEREIEEQRQKYADQPEQVKNDQKFRGWLGDALSYLDDGEGAH